VHGDFSAITFSPERDYSAVLDLQGRVGLDANRNEQVAILLHQLRTVVADLVGREAGPLDALGFEVGAVGAGGFPIGPGRYYLDGVLVTNHLPTTYETQPYAVLDLAGADKLPDVRYLVYLKAWERHVSEVEDPSLHEPALGLHDPDASSRAQVVWQVRAVATGGGSVSGFIDKFLADARSTERTGMLQVRARREEGADADPCTAGPQAAYTGENQLYRVEIRSGGAAGVASFVWSRDNGAVVHQVLNIDDRVVTLRSLGRDWHTTLEIGHWVEVVDDAVSLRRELGRPDPAQPLRRIVDLDVDASTVTLDAAPPPEAGTDPTRHPYLRRWDSTPSAGSTDGTVDILETPVTAGDDVGWIPLERGIEVRFLEAPAGGPPHTYRSADYWVFPARRRLGDVIWRHPDGSPPHGVTYHYASLAIVTAAGAVTSQRTSFGPLR
jgi:hypothetical protein